MVSLGGCASCSDARRHQRKAAGEDRQRCRVARAARSGRRVPHAHRAPGRLRGCGLGSGITATGASAPASVRRAADARGCAVAAWAEPPPERPKRPYMSVWVAIFAIVAPGMLLIAPLTCCRLTDWLEAV